MARGCSWARPAAARPINKAKPGATPTDTICKGGCHCGAIAVTLRVSRAPEDTPVRRCQCRFCRAHGARTTTDPAGEAEITLVRSGDVQRYRFALKTADYLVCRNCGIYVAAVIDTPEGFRSTINVNALDDRARFDPVPPPADYGGETAEERRARRAANWTPTVMR